VGLLARVRDYIDALVHPSAQQDAPGLLALHGGHIEIDSCLGEGPGVTFHTPMNCEHFRRGSETSAAARLPRRATDAPADIVVTKSG
jgi:hypothetical protein